MLPPPPKTQTLYTAKEVVRARADLTLFCDIYNVFLIFLRFFCAEFNPMSASLKSLSIFVDSRRKVNLKVKYDFSRNEARNFVSVIPHFHVILTGQSISETIFIIQGHLRG